MSDRSRVHEPNEELLSAEDAIADADSLEILYQQHHQSEEIVPTTHAESSVPSDPEAASMQRLVELGLLTEIKRPNRMQADPNRSPIEIEGKPLSEMIIEERR